MKVNFSDRAIADLDEIYEFISADSAYFANRTVNQLIEIAEELGKFPYSGRISAEYNNQNIRERIFRNYRIGYKIKEDSVEIATIRHMARMPE